MGSTTSTAFSRIEEPKILLLGLDSAGKTTALSKMKDGKKAVQHIIPNIQIGLNVETVQYNHINSPMFEVDSQDRIRTVSYYEGTGGLIYVVDCNDRQRIDESANEFHNLLQQEELAGVCVLVLANKQDLPDAMSCSEVTEKLNLQRYQGRAWTVQYTCAITGEGLFEGLEWLSNSMSKK